jgi:uncharacterized protein with PhoU and TrkA domain
MIDFIQPDEMLRQGDILHVNGEPGNIEGLRHVVQ